MNTLISDINFPTYEISVHVSFVVTWTASVVNIAYFYKVYTFTLIIAEEVLLINNLESECKELVVSSKFKASNT